MKELSVGSIELNNISFSYDGKAIFKNFSLAFPFKQRTAILAPSAWGKTTLLYLISGLLKSDTGEIRFPLTNPTFSMVFQENRLLKSASILHNLTLVQNQLSTKQITAQLAAVGLTCPLKQKPRQLSGGEQRRLSIVRALCADYDILLLDEPFTGLDGATKQKVIGYVRRQTEGKTVILVTHDSEEAKSLGCHIITPSA